MTTLGSDYGNKKKDSSSVQSISVLGQVQSPGYRDPSQLGTSAGASTDESNRLPFVICSWDIPVGNKKCLPRNSNVMVHIE